MRAVTGDMKEFWKSWILMLVKVASSVSYKEACWGQVWELPNQISALSAPPNHAKRFTPNFALTKWNHASWRIFYILQENQIVQEFLNFYLKKNINIKVHKK